MNNIQSHGSIPNTEYIPATEQNFTLHAPLTYLPPSDYDENLNQLLKREDLKVFTHEEHKKIRAKLMRDSAIQKMEEGSWEMSRREILRRDDFFVGVGIGTAAAIISSLYHTSFVFQREARRFALTGLGAFSLSMLYHLIQIPRIEKEFAENVKLRESVFMPRAGQRDLLSIADKYLWEDESDPKVGVESPERNTEHDDANTENENTILNTNSNSHKLNPNNESI